MEGGTKGRTGIGTAWGSVGTSSVAREGDESMMRVRGVYRAEEGTEELETAWGGVERERSARGVMSDVKITPAKVADPDSSYVTRRKTAEFPGL